jgi:hypothetical protein
MHMHLHIPIGSMGDVATSASAAGYGGASDDEGGGGDAWGAMQAADEAGDGDLLSAPRKVPNAGIAYARSSKQVCCPSCLARLGSLNH